MVQERAPVLSNRRIAPDHYLLRLKSVRAARRARPGQFVHVLCEGEWKGRAPLLRRPLSLSDADPRRGTIDFIYKTVGLGTEVLARVRAGTQVDFLGPLGHPFTAPALNRVACLVGGGVGIPPLYFLAKKLVQDPKGFDPESARINPGTLLLGQTPVRVEVFLGARTKGWVICAADFRKLDLPVYVATDDGSLGYRGSVVDLVAKQLPANATLYVCGPTPMMAAAARLARETGIPAQVSLEERMGCAMGVCMGCVVEVTTKPAGSHARFQRVCTEGPVFDARDLAWR